MAKHKLLGYTDGDSFIYQLSGVTKFLFLILVSIAAMTTYDTRLIALIAIGSLVLFKLAKIRLRDISFILILVLFFSSINLILVYLFSPSYGEKLYGSSTLLFSGWGPYHLTAEEVFYLFNLLLKYFCTVPLAILFLMTTHPSQFASSLNQIGLPYKFSYAVSLTLRYIPDIQEEFQMIKLSQEARGIELSQKGSLLTRIKGNLQILVPLIFSSLERIDTISTTMELRRFGKEKKRTWYTSQDLKPLDYLAIGLAVLVVLVTLILFWVNGGRFYNPFRT